MDETVDVGIQPDNGEWEIETEVVVEHLDLDRQELARDEGYEQRINEQFEALKINLKQEVDAGLQSSQNLTIRTSAAAKRGPS